MKGAGFCAVARLTRNTQRAREKRCMVIPCDEIPKLNPVRECPNNEADLY
jgi:hypothetical protein